MIRSSSSVRYLSQHQTQVPEVLLNQVLCIIVPCSIVVHTVYYQTRYYCTIAKVARLVGEDVGGGKRYQRVTDNLRHRLLYNCINISTNIFYQYFYKYFLPIFLPIFFNNIAAGTTSLQF